MAHSLPSPMVGRSSGQVAKTLAPVGLGSQTGLTLPLLEA